MLLTAYLILFFSADPSPLTPYVGCHLTWSDPNVFISWVLFLVYDTGMVVIYGTTQSGICWKAIYKWCWYWWPFQLWKFLSLFQSLIRVYNFSEIIQIAREVDHTSWKLFIETVSPIYNLSSFFQSNDLIGVLYYLYLFSKFMRIYCTFLSWHHPSPIVGKHDHGADVACVCIHLLHIAASDFSNSPVIMSHSLISFWSLRCKSSHGTCSWYPINGIVDCPV